MTPYYAEINGLPEGKQAKLAESILFDINEPVTPSNRTQRKFHFRICPECMKQDVGKYGFWYFHLKHHLPDVFVCKEHKVPLILLEGFDKRKSCVPDIRKGCQSIVTDMNEALLHTEAMENAYEKNKGTLISKICPDCGKEYLVHPFSVRTGAGCPFCRNVQRWETFIQHRIEILYGEEYRLVGGFTNLRDASVQHIPCGVSKHNLELLLWDKRGMCSGCKALTVQKMQKQIDPEKKEYIIHGLYRNQSDSRMVTVTHVKCGNTFDIHPDLFLDRPHCIYCERKQRALENRIIHPNYEIVSEYKNNRENVLLRHKDCGCVFPTSKTKFLAGMRCPVCTNHYDFRMVSEAVMDCTEGYEIERGKNRGTVILYYHGNVIEQNVPYGKVMNDLQLDEPKLLKNRHQKYSPPRSIRRRVYDAVANGTKEKGFWEAKDGIEGDVVLRGDRNILQDLTNQGYIIRIDKGKYRIYEDSYKYYDGNTG